MTAEESAGGGAREDWEAVRGDDPRGYDQMMGDAEEALARSLDRLAVLRRDEESRERVARWWEHGPDEDELELDREGPS